MIIRWCFNFIIHKQLVRKRTPIEFTNLDYEYNLLSDNEDSLLTTKTMNTATKRKMSTESNIPNKREKEGIYYF